MALNADPASIRPEKDKEPVGVSPDGEKEDAES